MKGVYEARARGREEEEGIVRVRGRRSAETPDGVGRHVRAHGCGFAHARPMVARLWKKYAALFEVHAALSVGQQDFFFLISDGLYWKPAKRN